MCTSVPFIIIIVLLISTREMLLTQFWRAATQNAFDNFRTDTCYFQQKKTQKTPMFLNDIIEMFCSANLPSKTLAFDKCFSELFFNHKDCKNSHLPRFYFCIYLDITKNVNTCFDQSLRVCNLLLYKSYMFDWCRTNLEAKICTQELELLSANALYLKQPVKHQHSLWTTADGEQITKHMVSVACPNQVWITQPVSSFIVT